MIVAPTRKAVGVPTKASGNKAKTKGVLECLLNNVGCPQLLSLMSFTLSLMRVLYISDRFLNLI